MSIYLFDQTLITGIFIKDFETKVKKDQIILTLFNCLQRKQIERGLATSNDTVSNNDVKLRW